jgi:hypothetical protein
LRAPHSLTQALQEAVVGNGSGWPHVEASPEAFFQRCQTLPWRFFANLHEAFLAQVLPPAPPVYASPVHTLRERLQEVWIVDGSRLDAVAKRLKLLWDRFGTMASRASGAWRIDPAFPKVACISKRSTADIVIRSRRCGKRMQGAPG